MHWMIYGANGYAGEMTAREAKRRGLTPILAGRSVSKVAVVATSRLRRRSRRILAETGLDHHPRIRSDGAVRCVLCSRLARSFAGLAARALRALRNVSRPSGVAGGFIADLTRSRAELITENALLRQQLIVASRAVIRDRDDNVGAGFDRIAKGAGARVLQTAVQAPLMNSVCERFLGSIRRECLDCVIILSEAHLRHVLGEYALSYFNTARPHQGIGQRTPVASKPVRASLPGSVTTIPVLGGLHHDYRAAA